MNDKKLTDLCDTFVYSEGTSYQQKLARGYIFKKLGYPDKGSEFAKQIGKLKHLFRLSCNLGLISYLGSLYLKRKTYDLLLLNKSDEIIGHSAFQIHDDNSLHAFSLIVNSNYRGNGLATHIIEKTIEDARRRGINMMRVGGGKNKASNKIYQNILERFKELGIIAYEDNWLKILY